MKQLFYLKTITALLLLLVSFVPNSTMAQKPSPHKTILGYYPMNYKIQQDYHVKNRIIGEGDQLCIWIKGKLEKEKLKCKLSCKTIKEKEILFTQIEYLTNEDISLCILKIPQQIPLFEEFEIAIFKEQSLIDKLTHFYTVPNIKEPEIQIKDKEIILQFTSEKEIGTAPYQYTWRDLRKNGEIIQSGQVLKLNDIPSLKGIKESSLLNLIIKDANNLILNKWLNYKTDSLTEDKNTIAKENTISIYPNPTSHYLNISSSLLENEQEFKISIYDLQGKLALGDITISSQNNTIDISKLRQGFYSLYIGSEKKMVSNFIKL